MDKRKMLASLIASACTLSALSTASWAQSPTVEDALSLKPIQSNVEYERPGSDAISRCKIEPLSENGWTGWVVYGSDGRTLRRFADTNKDGDTDLWCYFQSGVEVYRDIDSDFDKRADQYRWLGTAGTRIGQDPNEDGKIESWSTISAQEVSAELIAAIASGDVTRFERLLLADEEIKSLGVSKELADKLSTKRRQAIREFARFVKEQKSIGNGARWVHFAANMPGTVPAGSAGAEKDLTVYENAVAMFESDKSTGQLLVGTIVKVDDAWRLIDLPQIAGGDGSMADATGFFFSGASLALNDSAAGGISGDLQKLVTDLEKIDLALQQATGSAAARLHEQRVDVMEGIIASSDADQRESWVRQLVDTIGAAVESDTYPKGLERLEKLSVKYGKNAPEIQAYIDFQIVNSEYALRVSKMSTNKDFAEVQEWRLKSLESFVDKHPGTIEEARAMLKIGLAKELEDDSKSAVSWYTKVATNFRNTDEGQKAAGAVRRLESVGREISLKGRTLDNKALDLAQLKGKPVVVHYWATWCEPCKQDMKLLLDLQARYQKAGLTIVGVNVDADRRDAVRYVNESRIPWFQMHEPGGLDGSPLANALGVQTLPTMLLIDANGKVVQNNVPASQLNEEIDSMLRSKR